MWEREREHHGERVLGDLCNGYVLVYEFNDSFTTASSRILKSLYILNTIISPIIFLHRQSTHSFDDREKFVALYNQAPLLYISSFDY